MGSIKSGARCVRNFDPVYVGLGSKAALTAPKRHFRSTPKNGHRQTDRVVRSVPKAEVACLQNGPSVVVIGERAYR